MSSRSILFIVIVIFFTSCRKYDEGPSISFRTKKERIANQWEFKSCKVDGMDETRSRNGVWVNIEKDGAVEYDHPIFGTSYGSWKWVKGKEQIALVLGKESMIANIHMLKENKLKLSFLNGGVYEEWFLVSR